VVAGVDDWRPGPDEGHPVLLLLLVSPLGELLYNLDGQLDLILRGVTAHN